jgi:hypothetical protein
MATLSETLLTRNAMPMFEADLSSLASKAAIEIDNLILGRGKKHESIKKLAKKLSESIQGTFRTTECKSLINPTAVTIMGRAINKGSIEKIDSVDEIIIQAQQIADTMNKSTGTHDKKQLEEIRTFCVALSISAASHRLSTADQRPKHPFRK